MIAIWAASARLTSILLHHTHAILHDLKLRFKISPLEKILYVNKGSSRCAKLALQPFFDASNA
jgi:hypothetical protein